MTTQNTNEQIDQSLELLIAQILEQRHRFAARIGAKRKKIERLHQEVAALLAKMNETETMKIGTIQPRLQALTLEILKAEKQLHEAIEALSRMEQRFQRDTISIVVAGTSGQGKSVFLQQASRLTSDVIPSGSSGDCSAVRSTICHTDGEPYAEVSFHTREAFLTKIVLPYFIVIAPDRCPRSLDDFLKQPLPVLDNPSALHQEYLKRLATFRDQFAIYGELLTGKRDHRIAISEVREYVAKYDVTATISHFKYMAVEEVRIHTTFPRYGLRQVALVDMQGMGSAEVGIEKRTIETMREVADAVIFIKKPDNARALIRQEDFSLYETVQSGLPDMPLSDWAFLVLNHDSANGDNWQQCAQLRDDFAKSAFRVRQTIISDCSQPTVADDVLKPVLQHLRNHLEAFDSRCIQSIQQLIGDTHATLIASTEQFEQTIPGVEEMKDLDTLADTYFEDTFDRLNSELSDEMLMPTSEEFLRLKEKLDELTVELKNKQEAVPSEADFRAKVTHNDVVKHFQQCKHSALSYVRKQVESFESVADEIYDNIRDRVRQKFEAKGRLAGLKLPSGQSWWQGLADEIGQDSLSRGLVDDLEGVGKVNYRSGGLVAKALNGALAKLDPDDATYSPYRVTGVNWRGLFKKGASFDQIFVRTVITREEAAARLHSAFMETVREIESKGEEIARNTVDEIGQQFRMKVLGLVTESNKIIWRTIYRNRKRRIWHDEFESQLAKQDLLKNLLSRARSVRQFIDEHTQDLCV